MQKPLAPQHRRPAKLALFSALRRERPDFFVELQARASEFAVKGFGANDELGRFLDRFGLDTPWIRLHIARAARKFCGCTDSDKKVLGFVIESLQERPGAQSYGKPRKSADFEDAATWYVKLASGLRPSEVRPESVLPTSFHQRVHRFAEVLDLRPFAFVDDEKRRGPKPGVTRRRTAK